jgi:hypothetical protein
MISPDEVKQFTEDDQQATEIANRGGRPWPIDGPRALLLAVGVFILLEVFASVTLPDRDKAVWPATILTGVVAGGAYWFATLQRASLVSLNALRPPPDDGERRYMRHLSRTK